MKNSDRTLPHLPVLKGIGLSETEAIVFETLLLDGPSTGATIAKNANIGRGNAYNALATLKTLGLVEELQKKKTLFRAMDPEQLRTLANSKRMTAQLLAEQIEVFLPDLKSRYRLFAQKPTLRFFEGIEGLKTVYTETLKEKQMIYALVSPDEPAEPIFRWLTTSYVQARVKGNIHVRVVVNGTSRAQEYIKKSKEELREARFVHSETYPFRGEVDVFGDNIAFIAYKEDELIGTILESPSIAETLRSTIRLLMDILPKTEE